MSTLASLRILLGLDSADVSRGAGRVRQELTGVQRSANIARDSLKGVAAGFGLGVGFGAFQVASKAVGELTAFLGDSVKAAIAEEAGIKRLDQSLKANVASWDGNRDAIERTIAARQALGFADDEQRDAMARALVATNDVTQAQNILATAMDLARLKGIDLGSATDALIKIEAGQFRALKALGIELKDGATQTEALAAVQRVAAGQAEEFAGTTAGAMAAAAIEIENLKEDFGALLAGPITELAGFIRSDLIPAIRDTAKFIGDLGTEVGKFGDAVADAVDPSEEFLNVNQQNILASIRSGKAFDAATVATNISAEAVRDWTALEQAATEAAVAGEKAVAANAEAINKLAVGAITAAPALEGVALGIGAISEAANTAIADITDLLAQLAKVDASAIPGVSEAIAARGDTPMDTTSAQFTLDQIERERQLAEDRRRQRERDAADAKRAADAAAADAKRRADEAARQAERDAAEAKRLREQGWRDAQEAADRYFDRVHDANVNAIEDIRDKRNAELDAANAAAQAPVTAERARLAAIRDREREAELRSAVATAGPEDLAAAQRDLQRFLEDQRVERMQTNADAQIALNEAARENANAAADMARAAEALRDIAARGRFDPRVTYVDGVAHVNTADFEGSSVTVNINIDGQVITETIDRRLAARTVNITPTGVSTGSTR